MISILVETVEKCFSVISHFINTLRAGFRIRLRGNEFLVKRIVRPHGYLFYRDYHMGIFATETVNYCDFGSVRS
jgi:hypothetical protein